MPLNIVECRNVEKCRNKIISMQQQNEKKDIQVVRRYIYCVKNVSCI